MALERRWVVCCDAAGCSATLVVPAPNDSGDDDKWSAGMFCNDEGWDVRPGRREAHCPDHLETAAEGGGQ